MTDDDPRGVSLEDGWTVADTDWYAANRESTSSNTAPEDRARAEISAWPAFGAVTEAAAEALLGTSTETILPADGIVLMYGDGGAGKTTLTLDGVVHMADGRPWLGLEVDRAIRVLVIENEGPRAKFRQIIGEKLETLNGSEAGDRLHVLAEPWSRFSIADVGLRQDVADYVNANAIDLIVLGPLATVGMVGGGTPDEISAFEAKLRELRALIDRPVAFWIVHHENKAGDVSGAWERVPDTLIHVQAAGNGHTRIVFQKARWSSEYHGVSLNLTWSEGRTFTVVEDVERDYYEDVLKAFREADEWRTYKEVARLVSMREGEAKSVLAELTRRGDMQFERGPAGRHFNANCYRLSSNVSRLDDFEF